MLLPFYQFWCCDVPVGHGELAGDKDATLDGHSVVYSSTFVKAIGSMNLIHQVTFACTGLRPIRVN